MKYFRVFNPYLQSKKFDKDAIFIKSVLKDLKDISPKVIHTENGAQEDIFLNYPRQIVGMIFGDISFKSFKTVFIKIASLSNFFDCK